MHDVPILCPLIKSFASIISNTTDASAMANTIIIKKIGPNEVSTFEELISLFEAVFETGRAGMTDTAYLQSLLAREDFIVLAALVNEKVVGGLTAYNLPQYYSRSSQLYIYDVAVDRFMQRKGIGRKMISALLKHCRQKGIKELFVQADLEDVHALQFYHSAGGTPQSVVQFTFSLLPDESGR